MWVLDAASQYSSPLLYGGTIPWYFFFNSHHWELNLSLGSYQGNRTIANGTESNISCITNEGDSTVVLDLYFDGDLWNQGVFSIENVTSFDDVGFYNVFVRIATMS